MPPVQVIQLDLHEVPLELVMTRQQIVEHPDIPMIRKTQVADASGLALFQEEIHHPVVEETGIEQPHAVAPAHGMQQVIVDAVHLHFLERLAIHGNGILAREVREIGKLGSHEIRVPGMAAQGDARGTFRKAPAIGGRRVEIVHPVRHGVIHQFVHHLLVYLSPLFPERQAHHAEAQERHLVARGGIVAHGHASFGHLARTCPGNRRAAFRPATIEGCRSGRRASPEELQELAAPHFLMLMFFLFHIPYCFYSKSNCGLHVLPHGLR